MKPYFYKKLPTLGRVFLALIGAQYILIIPQDHPLSQLLQLKGYYVALLASTVIAWLLIWLSHQVHLQLNQRLPWEGRMVRRLLAQVFFGLVLMMGLDLLLVWCYFYLYHQDFLHSRYMRVEAQMVGWMLLCLNITRICYDLIQEKQNQNKLFVDDQEFVHYIQACLGRKRSRIALDEIILFYHASHIGYAYLINGEIWNTDYTLNTLEKKLPPDFGFRINRSLMVNWQSVRSYEALGNMQGRLTIKHPIEPRLNLMISRNRFKNFKKNYEQYKGRKRYLNKF